MAERPSEERPRSGSSVVQLRTEHSGPGRQRTGPDPLGRRLVLVLAALSAVAAGLAPGHPTGLAVLDVILKCAAGASCALLGSLVAWPFLGTGSLLVAVVSLRYATVFPSAAALALSLGGGCGRFRPSRWGPRGELFGDATAVVRCAVGAVICQVALRLAWPRPALSTALVAAVAMLFVLVPGLVAAPPAAARWVLRGLGIVLLVAVALSAVALYSLLSARGSVTQAIDASQLAMSAADSGDQQSATTDFATARSEFSAASNDLAAARFAEVVPVVSQQVRAVRSAAAFGAKVDRAGEATTRRLSAGSLHVVHGRFPVRAIGRLRPVLAVDLSVLRGAARTAASIRSPWLASPIQHKLDEERSKLGQATHDARVGLLAVRAVPQLLGLDGPRNYLVMFENPAETRASGGVVGDYAQLRAAGGKLSLVKVGSTAALDSAGDPAKRRLIGPPDYLERYSQFQPQLNWQNVPMSPDFQAVGEVAAGLYPQSGGVKVNGVISIDPVSMAGFLAATGPVQDPQWPTAITKHNVVALLAHDEFIQFAGDEPARVQFIQSLIRLVWHQLVSRPLPSIPQLTTDLLPSLRTGHLLLYSKDASAERFFETVHVAGTLPAVHGDYLGVVTQNAAGNKLDWYLRRTISYKATLDRATGTIYSTVTLGLHNSSPATGLPPVLGGPYPGVNVTEGENELYVSIYSPWQSEGARLDGKPFVMTDQQELGRFVYSGLVKVPPGGEATLVLHLVGQWPRHAGRYSLAQYHQPLLFPDHVETSVRVMG